MTGSCWRLLVFSLTLVAPALLHGQDEVADRPAARGQSWPAPHFPATGSGLREPPVTSRPDPVAPIVLPRVLQSAGIILSGRVISVGRAASPSAREAAFTSVTFQVEHAIRGTIAGQNLTIHEWAGLWERGERYRVGERIVLFLYPPSKLGLTSAVAGATGKFAIDPAGKVVINAPSAAAGTAVPYHDFARAVNRATRIDAPRIEMSQP